MLISYISREAVFATVLYKTFLKMYRSFFLKCFSLPPTAKMSVPFSKLWEQKRNTSVPAETGTREPSVERKRKYALFQNSSPFIEIIQCKIRKLSFSQTCAVCFKCRHRKNSVPNFTGLQLLFSCF